MQNKILTTPVDTLVEIIGQNKKCSITFIQSKLKLPVEIIEKWLVILEEYKVVNIHYSGLEGYVTLIEDIKEKNNPKEVDISNLKERFIERSKIKEMDYNKMKKLWPIFLLEYEGEIKNEFMLKAKKMGYEPEKIDKAWIKYKLSLEEL